MARAFGKVILAGEHSVVYDHPAIASTIQLCVSVTAHRVQKSELVFINPVFENPLFDQILPKLEQLFGPCIRELEFRVESEVPGGCGLGSSAALSVALIRSVLESIEESRNSEQIASMALELEKIFHGNPSGVDHTVIAQEGLIWFQKGRHERIIPRKPLFLVIAMATPHAGTLQAVQLVRRQYQENPQTVGKIFESIALLTRSMRSAIERGELNEIGDLMNENHQYLKALNVSNQELDDLCLLAKRRGALGAKLTGAGGGGCIIALAEDPEEIYLAFREDGHRAWISKIS